MATVTCAASGCTNTRDGGRTFARCEKCEAWWCSKHGTKGNRCPGCGHNYLKGNSSGGGCFITTATLRHLGKPDDCEELQTFRSYRDYWLAHQQNGPEIINEYYKIAPKIVESINSHVESTKIYAKLWEERLQPAYNQIIEGNNSEAKVALIKIVNDLKAKYLPQ